MIGALLVMAARAEPAIYVNCTGLGDSLAFVGRGGARVSSDDPKDPPGVPEGQWTLRFLTDELGAFEVRPNTVVIATLDDALLLLAEWEAMPVDRKVCKRLRKAQLPASKQVLVSVPLAQ